MQRRKAQHILVVLPIRDQRAMHIIPIKKHAQARKRHRLRAIRRKGHNRARPRQDLLGQEPNITHTISQPLPHTPSILAPNPNQANREAEEEETHVLKSG